MAQERISWFPQLEVKYVTITQSEAAVAGVIVHNNSWRCSCLRDPSTFLIASGFYKYVHYYALFCPCQENNPFAGLDDVSHAPWALE